MDFIFQIVNIVYYIDSFAHTEDSLHTWDKAHLIMMYDPYNVFFDYLCYSFVEDFCTSDFFFFAPVEDFCTNDITFTSDIFFIVAVFSGFAIRVIVAL